MQPKVVSQARFEWELREISLSLIARRPRCWHSHWRRWMNLIWFPFLKRRWPPDAALCLYSPLFFSPAFRSWNPRMCKKTSERILTKTDLSCGLMWPLVFLHPWRRYVAIFHHDHVIVLIMAVYVCVWLSTVGSNKLCFVPWGKYHVEGSSTATEGYVVVLLPDI